MEDIVTLSAVDLARRIRSRELSASEVLGAFRAQVDAVNGTINAFVSLDWEVAERRAAELDAMAGNNRFAGGLHGVPIGIKDIFETRGLRTTWASKTFADHVPGFDALHVARLRAAGAVIVGKTNTPEFAFSGQTSNLVAGTTRNPLDPAKTVGGSSGGSAAALAANMVALADGSDLGGSLRSPAAWCGVVGFRPSSGLVPYGPNPMPFDGLSIPGPMARNVTDLVLMLEVMQGNSGCQPLGFWQERPRLDKLDQAPETGRVAFCLSPFGSDPEPSIQKALTPVRDLCTALGWSVADAAPDLAPLLPFGHITRGLSAMGVRAALGPDMSLAGDGFAAACRAGDNVSLSDYAAYQAVRARVWQATVAFFETYDFAIWPTTCGLAFSADLSDQQITEDWRTVTLTPVMELPSVSIPFGTSSDGLPVGLHITGPKGSDAKLLRFARQIERAATGQVT